MQGNIATMTPDEMRAARALINISLEDLSSKIAINVDRLERFEGGWSVDTDDHAKIMSYFQEEGIEFLSNGVGYANSQTFHGVSTFFMLSMARLKATIKPDSTE